MTRTLRRSLDAVRRRAAVGLGQLLLVLALALFVPAGTLAFWQGWLYLGVFGASCVLVTWYLARASPALLERRLRVGPVAEQQTVQKVIQSLAGLAFLSIFVLAALDHRLGWSSVPLLVVIAGDGLVVLGMLIVLAVFRENAFTAATIGVAADQQLVDSGPYAVVRHPMYAGALVMLLGTPLALGSWWSLLGVVALALLIAWRLLNEEQFLSGSLPGYAEYRGRVRARLIPGVW